MNSLQQLHEIRLRGLAGVEMGEGLVRVAGLVGAGGGTVSHPTAFADTSGPPVRVHIFYTES
jgi:hypothetical protein